MDHKSLIELIETKMPNEDWFITEKEVALVTVPMGEWKTACEKILSLLGIKIIEDVPSKFKILSDDAKNLSI
jgi:hypothetical protein